MLVYVAVVFSILLFAYAARKERFTLPQSVGWALVMATFCLASFISGTLPLDPVEPWLAGKLGIEYPSAASFMAETALVVSPAIVGIIVLRFSGRR